MAPVPNTLSDIAATLAELKKLPLEQKARLLLGRLTKIGQNNDGALNKHNLMLPGDPYALAHGYPDGEKRGVREHLFGAPWMKLVNEGYLVDLNGQGFYKVSDEGREFLNQDTTLMAPPLVAPSTGAPRAFLSYSWDGLPHRDWVRELAGRLQEEGGVDIVFDQWHLNPGNDKLLFMEQAVADSDFVIVVCTPNYAERANKREGGVGYESMVITAELAEHMHTNKFIPVLRDGAWTSSLPVYLKSRMGVNLSSNPYAQEEYEKLLRVLHGEPIQPPPIGKKPDFTKTFLTGTKGTSPQPVVAVPSSAPQPSEQFGEQILASRKEFAQRNPLDNKTYDYFLETAFIPESFVNRRFEIGKLRQIAFEASVDFVGWPFLPIHSNRPDVLSVFEDGLQSFWYTDDYFGGKILDFWRLYESGLFYKKELPSGVFEQPDVAVYPIVAQYFALAVDCLARLYTPLVDLQESVTFRATITGTKGRRMVNGTQGLPLSANYTSQIPIIQVEQTHSLAEWKSATNDFAAAMMAEVQTRFNWIQRDSSLAKQIIDRILSRTF